MFFNCGVGQDSEIQPVYPKADHSWVFIGRTDVEAETPILWPPDAKSWLIWKDPDAGKDSAQKEKGTTEDEMAGWHHWLDGCESEWTLGVGDGQGGLVCCDSWGHKELDTTERLNWTELECKSRKSRDTWSHRQIWPWSTKWSRAILRGGNNTQKNYTKKIFMTQITTMVWSRT